MEPRPTRIKLLRRLLLDDIFKDFDDSSRRWLRLLMEPIVWPSAHRFAKIAAIFDLHVEHFGLREGMRRILPYFVSNVEVCYMGRVPEEGPLLVISNHPGTYDSIAIAATLPRTDLNIMAAGFPLLQKLPSVSQHLIFIKEDMKARMKAVRSAIHHLQEGGAVLLFPSGRVEPDPACITGASEAMNAWSSSIELFLRKVPQIRVLPTIVSGVLSPRLLNSPFIRFWRGIRDPQAVAEVTQIIIQMLFPEKVQLVPRISYGIAKSVHELNSICANQKYTLTSIIEEARWLLSEHQRWIDNTTVPVDCPCE